MAILYVTYDKGKVGVNDYIENFLLKNFKGRLLRLKEDFSYILFSKERIVHIHFDYKPFLLPYFLLLFFLLKMKGKKVVVTLHSVVLPSISEKAFQDYFSESPVLRLFEKTKIVKIVTFFVNKLLSFFSDVLIYHSQCPFDFKNPKAIEIYHPIHEFRKKTKVGKKSKTVVFLGKIVRYKGFNLLVDAAEMLPELEFVIFYSFFDYRSKKDFEALRKARKLKNVVLEKNASDSLVEKTLKQAHCVVFPFINALGFSNALSKAIALKKVIVATDVGVFKNLDFVIKTECNAASLADGLRKAFSLSGNKYKKLLKRMKEYEKRANVQKFIFTHEEIYKKLEGN